MILSSYMMLPQVIYDSIAKIQVILPVWSCLITQIHPVFTYYWAYEGDRRC